MLHSLTILFEMNFPPVALIPYCSFARRSGERAVNTIAWSEEGAGETGLMASFGDS